MLSRVELKIRSQQIKVRTASREQPETRTELIRRPGLPNEKAWASATFRILKRRKSEIIEMPKDRFALGGQPVQG